MEIFIKKMGGERERERKLDIREFGNSKSINVCTKPVLMEAPGLRFLEFASAKWSGGD